MGRHLPAIKNGDKPAKSARDAKGRFLPGWPGGPGRPVANPFARQQAELRVLALAAVTPDELQAVVTKLLTLAKSGSVPAAECVFRWLLGDPPVNVHPDRLDHDEMSVRRTRPTLVDWVALADEQADRAPGEDHAAAAAATEDEAASPDPLAPQLQETLIWAVRQLAEAQMPRAIPAPDPAAGWETFAASRLEWAEQAAAPCELIWRCYGHWCASHGLVPWPEGDTVSWLIAHGGQLVTRAEGTWIAGVRVVE